MNNILQNSLLTKYLQNKGNSGSAGRINPVQLKPLPELVVKQCSGISINDYLIKKLNPDTPKLIKPLQLFNSENEPQLSNPFELFNNNSSSKDLKSGLKNIKIYPENGLEQNINNIGPSDKENVTIIEPGVSAESIKAIKQIPGKQWLGKLASNGNREAAVIIPEGVDYNKPFEIIYHFHGHNGTIGKSLTDANYGLKDQIKNMAKDRNIIIVVPQGPPKALDYTWMNGKNKEDMQQFENDTLNIIKTLDPRVKISSVTVKGHSAGGRPIMNSALEGKLTADRIDFLDSSYGNWASQTYNSFIKKNPDAKFNVIYIPGSQTQPNALSLQGKKGVSFIKSKVDHSSVPKQYFSI